MAATMTSPSTRKPTTEGTTRKRNLAKTVIEASAKNAGDFVGCPERTTHHREFGGGDGHAEQTDGESVESLRVGQSGNGAGGQPTGEETRRCRR